MRNGSRAVLVPLLSIAFLGCATPARRSEPGAQGRDVDLPADRERWVFVEGCAAGILEPNERQYAKRKVERGDDPDYARAEAHFALASLRPAIEETCGCLLDRIGPLGAVRAAAAAKGVSVEAELQARMEADPAKVASCVDLEKIMTSSPHPTKAAFEQFRKDYQAKHPR